MKKEPNVYQEIVDMHKEHPEYGELGIFAGYGECAPPPIVKTNSGFSQDCDLMTLEWDHQGKYRGQWQDDMLSEELCSDRIFIGPDPTGKCFVPDLTPEQMQAAQVCR